MDTDRSRESGHSPRGPTELDKELFDRIAGQYSHKYLVHYCLNAKRLKLNQTLSVLPRPLGRVLEVGCGEGFVAEQLAGQYTEYVGIDYSKGLIEIARERRRGTGAKISFIESDLFRFHDTRPFDVVLMIGVLHHIPMQAEALQHAVSFLRPGGVLVLNEPQPGNPVVSLARRIRKAFDPVYSVEQEEISRSNLKRLTASLGLSAQIFSQGFLTIPLAETTFLPELVGNLAFRVLAPIEVLLGKLAQKVNLDFLSWNVVGLIRNDQIRADH